MWILQELSGWLTAEKWEGLAACLRMLTAATLAGDLMGLCFHLLTFSSRL